MFEFAKIYLSETNPKLGKKGQTYWVVNSKDRFCRGGADYRQELFLETETEGASRNSGSSLLHSDK